MRSWERAAAALACLTPRDRALLRVLRDLRYLTCEQALRACYPGLAPRSVRARLGALRRRGLIAPLRRGVFADRRTFWGLDPLGRAAAAALEAAEGGGTADGSAAPSRSAVVAALQLEHLSGTNDLFCDLCEIARAGRLPPLRWLAASRSAVDLGQTRLVPDAAVLIAGADDGWWTYYVERDRGTMPIQAMRDKLERYALLFKMAGAQSDDPAWQARADAWLLFVCDDLRRAKRLAALAAGAGLDRVWAGLADACAAGLAGSLSDVSVPRECPALPAWARGALAVSDTSPSTEEEPT
ncbi:MAG: replication-relaxation family protein [bacterium]